MRDDDTRHSGGVAELADQPVHPPCAHRIEARGRLVEQHVPRVERQGARDRDALSHPVAQLGWESVAVVVHAYLGQPTSRFVQGVLHAEPAMLAQGERDVLDASHRIEERRVLEHHRALLPDRIHAPLVEPGHVFAVEPDLALVRTEEADELFDEDAFSGAGGADDEKYFTLLDVEADAAEYGAFSPKDFLTLTNEITDCPPEG